MILIITVNSKIIICFNYSKNYIAHVFIDSFKVSTSVGNGKVNLNGEKGRH